jgi:hypothetical protein
MVKESAHGKLSPVDQKWTGERFIGLLAVTLAVALVIIFVSASLWTMDFSWDPLAHDLEKHTFESSSF